MSHTIRVTSPINLLHTIPSLLGFVPSESLVLMFTARDSHRVLMTTRLDLDVATSDMSGSWLLPSYNQLMTATQGQPVDVVSVIVSGQPFTGDRPWNTLLNFVDAKVLDDLWVNTTTHRAGSYLCDGLAGCCPFDFMFDTVPLVSDVTVAPSRDSVAESCAFVGALVGPSSPPWSADQLSGLWGAAVESGSIDCLDMARILGCFDMIDADNRLDSRDRLLGTLARDYGMDQMPRWLLCRLASHTNQPSSLACLAALALSAGDGALAWVLSDRCDEAGGCSFGRLIRASLECALTPTDMRGVLVKTLDLLV